MNAVVSLTFPVAGLLRAPVCVRVAYLPTRHSIGSHSQPLAARRSVAPWVAVANAIKADLL